MESRSDRRARLARGRSGRGWDRGSRRSRRWSGGWRRQRRRSRVGSVRVRVISGYCRSFIILPFVSNLSFLLCLFLFISLIFCLLTRLTCMKTTHAFASIRSGVGLCRVREYNMGYHLKRQHWKAPSGQDMLRQPIKSYRRTTLLRSPSERKRRGENDQRAPTPSCARKVLNRGSSGIAAASNRARRDSARTRPCRHSRFCSHSLLPRAAAASGPVATSS